MTDRTHLAGRMPAGSDPFSDARHDHWGGPPVPAHLPVWHGLWAREYVRVLETEGKGAAFGVLHNLRYGEHAADVDPWRLLEHVAEAAMARNSGAEKAAAGSAAENPGGEPSQGSASAEVPGSG